MLAPIHGCGTFLRFMDRRGQLQHCSAVLHPYFMILCSYVGVNFRSIAAVCAVSVYGTLRRKPCSTAVSKIRVICAPYGLNAGGTPCCAQ